MNLFFRVIGCGIAFSNSGKPKYMQLHCNDESSSWGIQGEIEPLDCSDEQKGRPSVVTIIVIVTCRSTKRSSTKFSLL